MLPSSTARRPHPGLARSLGGLVAVLTALPLLWVAGGAAAGGSRWAPADRATITPGVQMFTAGAQCTGNFVFTDRRGRVYVGYAAHCAGLGEATDTDGCATGSLPLGTRVRFASGADLVSRGTTHGFGRLAYSSWRTMAERGVRRANPCAHNDFALVRVGRKRVGKVNPTVPFWGGPTGVEVDGVDAGSRVHGYASSSLRPTDTLSPRTGVSLGRSAGGWAHDVYTATPGVPGDSGSGLLGPDGRAFGTLSTVAVAPVPGSNGVGDLARELRFARRHSGIDGLRLVRGTRPFEPIP
ncbi:hypothetical protein [Nocardioides donggukensis]|uniref:Serine protease n=1 Tax=Nocardioides donggukensis TaxID=2774019 RepID=A0A927K9R3_9ACTN|nr:hypothetical protein [Nocardioides donggukensis]MBD8870235.1 hypothetical protein [Nocardioides donggukensis]